MTTGVTVSTAELIHLQHQAVQLHLTNRKRVKTQSGSHFVSSFRGRGMDFEEVRSYQSGDDVRNIDWRVTARTGVVHTKVFREERERSVLFLVDFTASMFFGTKVAFKSVIAARTAALLAWAYVRNGDRVGGVLFSDDQHIELRPRTRNFGVLPLLKNCAKLSQTCSSTENSGAFCNALQRLHAVAKPGSLIFIISDFMQLNTDAERCLSRLAQHNEIIAGFIYDPIEKEPPPPNRYPISDGAVTIAMDTARPAFCQHYCDYFQARLHYVKTTFNKRQSHLFQLATDQSIVKTVGAVL